MSESTERLNGAHAPPSTRCSFTDMAGVRCLLAENHNGGHENEITRSGPLRPWHNGYDGEMAWDAEVGLWHGEVQGIAPDVATFEGATANEAARAFRDTVADYIAMCATEPCSPSVSGPETPLEAMDGHDWKWIKAGDTLRIGKVTATRAEWIAAIERLAPVSEREEREIDDLREQVAANKIVIDDLIAVAHKHDWNGVTNSKVLVHFFDNALADSATEVSSLRASLASAADRLQDADIRVAELETLNAAHEVTIASLNERLPEFAALHQEVRALRSDLERVTRQRDEANQLARARRAAAPVTGDGSNG